MGLEYGLYHYKHQCDSVSLNAEHLDTFDQRLLVYVSSYQKYRNRNTRRSLQILKLEPLFVRLQQILTMLL